MSHDFHQGPPTDPASTAPDDDGDAAIAALLGEGVDLPPLEDPESDLAAIRSELAESAAPDTKKFPVEGRPGYAIECRLNFVSRDLDMIRRGARDRTFTDKLDGVKFAALLIAKTCVAVHRNGEPIMLDGQVATFTNPEFLEMFQRDGERTRPAAVVAIRRMFGTDGAVDGVGKAIMSAAGWGEDVAEDPTD